MDTSRPTAQEVEAAIAMIKAKMPQTYRAIQERADAIGKPAFAAVRRGLRGDVNSFYAIEGGHIVGTPFDLPDVTAEVAQLICGFGCKHLVMWGIPKVQELAHAD